MYVIFTCLLAFTLARFPALRSFPTAIVYHFRRIDMIDFGSTFEIAVAKDFYHSRIDKTKLSNHPPLSF